MTSKLWIAALIGGGLVLICAGIQQWRTNQAPEETVVEFLDAVKSSNRTVALRLMTPDLRRQVKDREGDFDAAWAAPPQDVPKDKLKLSYEIESLSVRGDTAKARTVFRHGKMPFINSNIHLQRTRTGLWKVSRIDNRLNLAWRMRENEQLAFTLREKIKGFSGAQVAKEPTSKRERR